MLEMDEHNTVIRIRQKYRGEGKPKGKDLRIATQEMNDRPPPQDYAPPTSVHHIYSILPASYALEIPTSIIIVHITLLNLLS